MNNKNDEIKILLKKLKVVLYYFFDRDKNNKLNIFFDNVNNVDKKIFLIQIKETNLFHLLGFHHWQKIISIKNKKDFVFMKTFINKFLNTTKPFDELQKIVNNSWRRMSSDIINKYSSNIFFHFLINRIKIFIEFIELIYENKNIYFYLCNNRKNDFISWSNNSNQQLVLKNISKAHYEYITYIPISIRINKIKMQNPIILKIRNIQPKSNLIIKH